MVRSCEILDLVEVELTLFGVWGREASRMVVGLSKRRPEVAHNWNREDFRRSRKEGIARVQSETC